MALAMGRRTLGRVLMGGLSVLMGPACFPGGHWHLAVHRSFMQGMKPCSTERFPSLVLLPRWKIGVRRASGQGPTHRTKGRKWEVRSRKYFSHPAPKRCKGWKSVMVEGSTLNHQPTIINFSKSEVGSIFRTTHLAPRTSRTPAPK